MTLSQHAAIRMSQLALSPAQLRLAVERGTRIQQNGAVLYYLGWRHLAGNVPAAIRDHWEGTAVVVGRDGVVVTAFRTRRLPRRLRRRDRIGPAPALPLPPPPA